MEVTQNNFYCCLSPLLCPDLCLLVALLLAAADTEQAALSPVGKRAGVFGFFYDAPRINRIMQKSER